jgi:hypothetical protein
MIRLIMTDEQSRDIQAAATTVEICDQTGRPLGVLVTGVTARDISRAAAVSTLSERRYTTEEVLQRLRDSDEQ